MSTVNISALASTNVNASTARIDASKLDPESQKKLQQLEEAAKGFEQLFVQQLLKSANFASEMQQGGYGAMATDAMASSVTSGGGMGLASLIRDSMIQSQLPELAPALQNLSNKGSRTVLTDQPSHTDE